MRVHFMGQHMIRLFSATPKSYSRACRAIILAGASLLACGLFAGTVNAQALGYAPSEPRALPDGYMTNAPAAQDVARGEDSALPDRLRRAVVNLDTKEAPGTIIIDTADTVLYYVLGGGKAIRYGVGVGRQGFTWSGVETISRKSEWPDWYPPSEMIARQPYLPRFVAGGPGNPLGARAMYLGSSEYRIHGTNDPTTIGKFVSSGCIRLTNEDVIDLFNRVSIGAKVVVLPKNVPLQARRLTPTPVTTRPVMTLPAGRQAMTVPVSRVD
ncbi:L,D-transpeptidase [Bradyrhizobium sp. ARR65]|uniref:L,D-transpeptidase n=1 Tax=Bradyrhizobium sp. ARR65 TaxID=1040989 RepID=UPI000AF9B813|nr:L,D-transpeptidase [Bradyrhizobium sp. ARR65]